MRIFALAMVAALGCSKKDSKEAPTPSAGTGGAPAGGGANGFEGTLKTSGLYEATWSVADGAQADPFNSYGHPSLKSDKQTFGNIKVELDGKVEFGSGASELPGGTFTGSGAKVTLDKSGKFVCAFTVDTDLVGSRPDTPKLHMSGGMTVHWHPDSNPFSCP